MVRFMCLSMPRSASTWLANWLTTEKSLCLHDPILTLQPDEFDRIPCDRMLGISCTGTTLLPGFVNAHPAKKLIVYRGRHEVDRSLIQIGLTPLGKIWDHALGKLRGMHVVMEALFNPGQAKLIYEYLTELPFDAARHEQLCDMHVEPMFDRVHVKADRAKDFARRVREALAS